MTDDNVRAILAANRRRKRHRLKTKRRLFHVAWFVEDTNKCPVWRLVVARNKKSAEIQADKLLPPELRPHRDTLSVVVVDVCYVEDIDTTQDHVLI